MTIIAAARNGKTASIGGDSGGFESDLAFVSSVSKIWRVGNALLGACGNYRVIELGKRHNTADPHKLRDLMAEDTHLPDEWGILIVTAKSIFEITEALDIFVVSAHYQATGSGTGPALGALHAMRKSSPLEAVKAAGAAALSHGTTVRPPFRVLNI